MQATDHIRGNQLNKPCLFSGFPIGLFTEYQKLLWYKEGASSWSSEEGGFFQMSGADRLILGSVERKCIAY